jgi:type IV secretory pathway VirB10-like protein
MQKAPVPEKLPTRRFRRALPVFAVVTLLVFSASSHAQWKWRDKDGRITVSDRPPPRDVADKDILMRPQAARRVAVAASAPASGASGASAAAAEASKTPLEREVEARKKAAEQEQATKAKAEESKLAAQRAENCQRARSQQAALDSGQRIARLNSKGEREVLDEKGRAEEMRQAREVIASDCK